MSNKTILCNLTLIRKANTSVKNQCIKAGQTKFSQQYNTLQDTFVCRFSVL